MGDASDAVNGRAATPAQPSAMPVTDQPAPAIRRSAPRPRWYRLYYLLAAFDLVTVALSLVLNHQTRSLFAHSIEVDQSWDERLAECSELGELAAAVHAPGDDVFDSRDVPAESARMHAARAAFDVRFQALRQEVQANSSPAEGARVMGGFAAVAATMDRMTADEELTFSYFAQGQPEQAGRGMATMDRDFMALETDLDGLRRKVAAIQQENLTGQAATAALLGNFEYVIAATIVLMVGRAVVYGYMLFKRMDADAREREKYLEELRDAEARTRSIVDTAADGIVTFDEQGRIESANPAAARLFGSPTPAPVGQPFADLVPQLPVSPSSDNLLPLPVRGEGRGEETRPPSYQELQGRRADGSTFPLELAVTELSLGDRRMFTAVIRDVTERKQAEEQQRRLVHEQAARAGAEAAAERIHRLQALTDAALAHLALDDLLRVLLGRVRDLLASETAAVLLLEGEELVVRAAAGLDDEVERANHVPLGVGFAGRIAAERRTIMVEDIGQADACPSLREKGIKSLLGAPLLVEGRVLGVLHVGTLVGRRWSEEDAQLLRLAADRVALAIDNVRLYGALAEREQQLQELVGQLILAQEEERRRIAYDVHDGLAQTAAGAHLHLQAFARRYQPHLPAAREELDRALELAQRTVREARTVVGELRPTVLDDLGLAAALEAEVQELRQEGWQVEFEAALGPGRLDPATETALFRVAQEALRNTRKHAQTRRARVALRRTERTIHLEVQDWGRGFDPAAQPAGGGPGERVGLSGMRERVALLGGRCEVRSRPGAGTRIVAEVPLRAPTEPADADYAASE